MGSLSDVLGDGGGLEAPGLGDAIGAGTNKELMEQARIVLSGSWGMAALGYFLYTALSLSFYIFLIGAAFFVSAVAGFNTGDGEATGNAIVQIINIVQFLIAGAFAVGLGSFFLGIAQDIGLCSFFLGISRDAEACLERLFTGFRRFGKSFSVYIFYTLFICLWGLLLIIPGIIASLRYAMVFFIIADDENCGPLEAISRSKDMMAGNKWKFFCLHWRFLWWGILCAILPIGFFWLVPYMQTSFAKFYESIKPNPVLDPRYEDPMTTLI